MSGRLEIPRSHKASGRKIDTWKFRQINGDEVEIDVNLISRGNAPIFTATSSHKLISHLSWENTDINALATTVETDVSAVFADHDETEWLPSTLVEVAPDSNTAFAGRSEVSLKVGYWSVALDAKTALRNDGTRRILRNARVETVIERSHALSDGTIEAGGQRYKIDTPLSRVVIPDTKETQKALSSLHATLESFNAKLAAALSPDRTQADPVPSPSDLVRMMQDAADGAAH